MDQSESKILEEVSDFLQLKKEEEDIEDKN